MSMSTIFLLCKTVTSMKQQLKILLYSNYFNIFAYSLLGPIYALFVLQVGGSAFHVGATWALYMFVAGLVAFYFSKIADHSGKNRRTFIITGYFLMALASLAFVFVDNLMQVYFVQFLTALGVGMLDSSWKASFAKYEDKGKEVQEWALFDGGDRILIALAAFLGGLFVTYFSFKVLFIIIFVIELIAAVFSIKMIKKN